MPGSGLGFVPAGGMNCAATGLNAPMGSDSLRTSFGTGDFFTASCPRLPPRSRLTDTLLRYTYIWYNEADIRSFASKVERFFLEGRLPRTAWAGVAQVWTCSTMRKHFAIWPRRATDWRRSQVSTASASTTNGGYLSLELRSRRCGHPPTIEQPSWDFLHELAARLE